MKGVIGGGKKKTMRTSWLQRPRKRGDGFWVKRNPLCLTNVRKRGKIDKESRGRDGKLGGQRPWRYAFRKSIDR